MTYEDVRLEIAEGVARIVVNRPARRNAMRDRTADELLAALRAAEGDDAVRVVLMTGEGAAFGAGYDLSTLDPGSVPDLARVLDEHFNPLVRAMRASRLPIVAAVNGACAGASVGLALAADIVIAGRSAFFYEPFVGIALVPDAGNTLFLSRFAGRIRASAAMMLGERIGGEEAERWGLVWRVVADGALMAEAQALCVRLAERDPDALAATKRLIARAAEPDLNPMLDLERDLQGEAGRSPAMRAAIDAFFAARAGSGS
ncbi:MAG: 2-(1,2-epoxy-1,2-dihydrophenyl)acetyl-CoA isomerase [Alphaproteobacteria bacterium HGW-Alphaproteobacteria-2]|nr:MAG: 2-(1,2-epoxy-1,2-dihydrophenyl)acetyl-CoA isomerase [Alphaproteobacteria bacterium HGW-Alphaproteobacteria-2]